MTRQEIKEQLSHDQFRDGVSAAITYAGDHRKRVTQLSVIALAVLLLVGAVLWFMSYQKGIRQQDLQAALDVWESPVGQNPAPDVLKSYPTQQAKDAAALSAFGSVFPNTVLAAKDLLRSIIRELSKLQVEIPRVQKTI